MLGVLVCGTAAYGYVLRLPMFWDDVLNFDWLTAHTLGDALTQRGSEVASFRPIQFAAWKLIYMLLGRYDAGVLHGLNLGLHLLNGVLLLALVRRISTSWLCAWAASVLFLLFPFGFQVVAPINALSYLLVTSCLLIGLYAWLRQWTGLAVAACLVAPLCHETGLLAALMLAALSISGLASNKNRWRRLLGPVLATLLGAFLWSRVAHGGGRFIDTLLGMAGRSSWNTAYFLQALSFPFSHFASGISRARGQGDDVGRVTLFSLIAVVLWLVVLVWLQLRDARSPALRIGLFGLALFGLCSGSAWFALDASYLAESPRALYPGALGVALFWAAPLEAARMSFAQWRAPAWRDRVALSILAIGVVSGAIGWSWVYLARRAELFDRMKQAIDSLLLSAKVSDIRGEGDLPMLVVNFPEWFYVANPEYLLGHDGLTTIGEGRQLDDIYALNTNQTNLQRQRFSAVALPDLQKPEAQLHAFGPVHTLDNLQELLRQTGNILVTQFIQDERGTVLVLRRAGQFIGAPYGRTNEDDLAHFVNGVAVITATAGLAYDQILVQIDLQASRPVTTDVTMFVQVLNESSQLIGQQDGYPLMGTSPIRLWRPGDRWRDLRLIRLDRTALGSPSKIHVLIGLYEVANGQRIPALRNTGQRFPDDAVVVGSAP